MFRDAPDLRPVFLTRGMGIVDLLDAMGRTCFEARNVTRGAVLLKRMAESDDVVWLGIAGAGIAGGMGGMVISLMEAGFIDVICSTGAQTYHDLHFAFDLPVKAIPPRWDDNLLRERGDTRIYDIGIRERETLEAQDAVIRRFVRECHVALSKGPLSSWEFNHILGKWVLDTARYPERSFVAMAAAWDIPIFWDSLANHSVTMNLTRTDREGYPVVLSPQKDIFASSAIAYCSPRTGFVELGGGGPKNFIQQTGPTISQILGIRFEGADRGLQIGTAMEREGSLSGCTFGEGVTWGKFVQDDEDRLVQIWGEYSVIFPLLAAYVLNACPDRPHKRIAARMPEFVERLGKADEEEQETVS